jgi:hypothetical protein
MVAQRGDLADLPLLAPPVEPRPAAAHLRVSSPTRDGLSIETIKVRGRRLYDRLVLDKWVDGLSDRTNTLDGDVMAALEALG